MNIRDGILKATVIVGVLSLIGGCATTTTEPKDESADVAPAADTRGSGQPTSYSVVSGDHLWGISSKPRIYGNPYQWPLIYKANSDKIKDADLIHPGQELAIERNASNAEVNAAIRHAKTRGEWSVGEVEESDKRYLTR